MGDIYSTSEKEPLVDLSSIVGPTQSPEFIKVDFPDSTGLKRGDVWVQPKETQLDKSIFREGSYPFSAEELLSQLNRTTGKLNSLLLVLQKKLEFMTPSKGEEIKYTQFVSWLSTNVPQMSLVYEKDLLSPLSEHLIQLLGAQYDFLAKALVILNMVDGPTLGKILSDNPDLMKSLTE